MIVMYADSAQGKTTVTDANLTIPLLMKNKVPDGFETDDRLNVSLRPDEVDVTFRLCYGQCNENFETEIYSFFIFLL